MLSTYDMLKIGVVERFFVFVLKGPLLYHYENMANELSIELSYEDIKAVLLKYGFVLEVNS